MSVLKPHYFFILVIQAIVLLPGCDRGSKDYQRIQRENYSEWDRFAQKLPVPQRLDLHKEILNKSSHNPRFTITNSFVNDPKATYDEISMRIISGDDSRYYLGVIYSIGRSRDFSICDQPDRKIIQHYLWEIATDAVKPADRPDFYRC